MTRRSGSSETGDEPELRNIRKFRKLSACRNQLGSSDRSRVVSATEAAKNFGEVLARVREERAVYVVERRGKPVAEIRPVEESIFTGADFVELVRATSDPSAGP